MFHQLIVHFLYQISAPVAQLGQAAHSVDDQIETVNVVEYPHIEGGGNGAFLLVAANMEIPVAAAVGQLMDQEKDVLKGLKSASGFLRRELGHSLQLRYTPELQFIADDSIAYGAHILEVLRDPEKVKPVNPDNDAVLPDEED